MLRRPNAIAAELLLDPEVDHEGAARQALTVAAVTGVDDERTLGQRVPDASTRASTLQGHGSSMSAVSFRAPV